VNIALWINCGLLAMVFLAGGAMKMIRPRRSWPPPALDFVEDISAGVSRPSHPRGLAEVGLISARRARHRAGFWCRWPQAIKH